MFSRIIGCGSYLPKKKFSNKEFSQFIETSDEWIQQRVGIKSRHFANKEESTFFMAHEASKKAIENANINKDDIELIIVASATSDFVFPSIASNLQGALNLNKNVTAFDVSGACCGFIHSLHIAKQFIENGSVKKALIVASEKLSRVIDFSDRTTCVLFGDGAGAFVLEASEETGVLESLTYTNGKEADILYLENSFPDSMNEKYKNTYLQMQGNKVFKYAVSEMSKIAVLLLEKANLKASDLNWFIPHQANSRIIFSAAKKLKIPEEKIILTLGHHGNTSAASIPLAFCDSFEKGLIKKGDKILFEAFGGGLVWGGAIVEF